MSKQTLASIADDAVITADTYAEIFNVNRNTVYRAMRAGDLPTHKVGGRVFIAVPALLASLGVEVTA